MVLKLFMTDLSPPVRAVLLTAKVLKIQLELVDMDLVQKNEQLKPEYLKLNPQHTVPTLDDNGLIIWDSHAIIVYLVTKYGKDKSLYPEDLYKRAVIDQRLHFDSGVLFPSLIATVRPIFKKNAKGASPEAIQSTIEAYEFLEKFLTGQQWMTGDSITLADLSIVASVSTLDILVPVDTKKFPNLTAWYKRMQALPYYSANKEGLDKIRTHILNKIKT